jgi:micrococcal nuclease
MAGQEVAVTVERVVDGDTVRVIAEGRSLSLRIQNLDTEESQPSSPKPVTPWGIAASDYVKALLPAGTPVTLRLQGEAPLFGPEGEVSIEHLDNFERLLGLLFLDRDVADGGPPTRDFQELMIRQGYSPYFVKYGRLPFDDLDDVCTAAERLAQAEHVGVWNQALVNGAASPEAAARDYPRLVVWWALRAALIDRFRAARAALPPGRLLDSWLDYVELGALAAAGATATVFLELRSIAAAGRHAVVDTGSRAQPFKLFIPEADAETSARVLTLLANRYVSDSEDHPRRNYAYVTGPLQLFRGAPELLVTELAQIADAPPAA